MGSVDSVLGAFEREMKAQGLWDSVAVLTVSDFGRTLTSNGPLFVGFAFGLALAHGGVCAVLFSPSTLYEPIYLLYRPWH